MEFVVVLFGKAMNTLQERKRKKILLYAALPCIAAFYT